MGNEFALLVGKCSLEIFFKRHLRSQNQRTLTVGGSITVGLQFNKFGLNYFHTLPCNITLYSYRTPKTVIIDLRSAHHQKKFVNEKKAF